MVNINGEAQILTDSTNLTEILSQKGFNLERIAVEYNGRILKKSEWDRITLQDEDCLEVVSFVGGG